MGGGIAAIIVFTFWTAFFAVLTVRDLMFGREDPVRKHLGRLVRLSAGRSEAGEDALVKDPEEQPHAVKQAREKLLRAGLKRRSDLEKYFLMQKACYAGPFFVSIVLYFFFHASIEGIVLGGVLSGIVFLAAPHLWFSSVVRKRRKEIRKYLPDTLDLFVVALEAGLSFDSALVRVAEEQRCVSTHISREFLYANQQILVGKSREEALRGLAERCGVDEMTSLVTTVIQANKLGMSLAKTLRTQAETLRKKRKQEIHAQILKAPVKLIFPLLFFIFPILLIVILGPSLVQIFQYLNVQRYAPS